MIVTLTKKLFERLRRKTYREEYVAEGVRTGVAYQVRALRDQRGWSQKTLAQLLGKPQSVVSRIEDPEYGKLSVQTLLELAAAFDVAVIIKFVTFPEFLRRTRNVSPVALEASAFHEEQFRSIEQVEDSFILTQTEKPTHIFLFEEPEASTDIAFVGGERHAVTEMVH